MPRAMDHGYTAETLPQKYLGAWRRGIHALDVDFAEAFVTNMTKWQV